MLAARSRVLLRGLQQVDMASEPTVAADSLDASPSSPLSDREREDMNEEQGFTRVVGGVLQARDRIYRVNRLR